MRRRSTRQTPAETVFAARRWRPVPPRPLGPVRVTWRCCGSTLQRCAAASVQGGELCEIAGVGPVPVSVAKELLGEAIVKLVITNGVDVANVTHLGRGPTAAQKAALLWMNPICSVAGLPPEPGRVGPPRNPGRRPSTPGWTSWTRCAASTTTSKPASAGRSQPAKANEPSSHPTTPDTPATADPQVSSHVPTPQRPGRRHGPAAAAAPPGKAGPPRTTRQAAAAQMTLPDPLTQSGGSGA